MTTVVIPVLTLHQIHEISRLGSKAPLLNTLRGGVGSFRVRCWSVPACCVSGGLSDKHHVNLVSMQPYPVTKHKQVQRLRAPLLRPVSLGLELPGVWGLHCICFFFTFPVELNLSFICHGQIRSLTSSDSAIDTGTIPARLQYQV